ncbi:MAG: NAD(+) synthase, partial [Synechococcales bacterium]|nr:NAD(+) synthase [Synechococcales bacterium]
MKIAIAQLNPTIGALQENSAQILTLAQQAQSLGARLMITPELSICGYPPRDLLLNPSFVDRMAETVTDLAQQLPSDLAVLVGTVSPNPDAIHGGKSLFNSVALLENGVVQQVFHKRLLPTYDVFDENRYFEPGRQANHFHLAGWHVGVTICEDLWNDEEFWGKRNYVDNPIADLADLAVDFTINLSASPYSVGKQAVREKMLQHTAQRFKQAILYVNQVGGNDDLIFDGGSFVVNSAGQVIARSPLFRPDLKLLECHLDYQPEYETEKSCDEQSSDRSKNLSGDRLSNQISDRAITWHTAPETLQPLPEDTDAEIWNALVLGVQDYARKCGFKQVVLGLSGGIDSALVAAIAAAALGAENVLGVLMPSPYSSDHSVQDALDLAERLGIQTQKIAIAPM